jgi:glutaminyl-peptide cyclotransferase
MRPARLGIYAMAALMLATSCGDKHEPATETTTTDIVANVPLPNMIQYTLVAMYPHDPGAFTEGLQYVDGYLYEGTGVYGTSDLRKTDLKTGNVLQSVKMDGKYFGEGITVLNGKIYQLTYKEKAGFVYDLKTMKQTGTFNFNTAEGWGMTNDGTSLIYGDGTSNLYYLNPNNFSVTKQLQVKDNYGPVGNINELEYIKGYIYANQWRTDLILKIDPQSGLVVAQANLSGLHKQGNIPPPNEYAEEPLAPDVLNGIAYDSVNNRIFVTGKYWPKVFEIKLDN